MNEKKPYSPPEIVRVELNHEQAILASCSTSATNAMAGTTTKCQNFNCKNAGGGNNNVGRPC